MDATVVLLSALSSSLASTLLKVRESTDGQSADVAALPEDTREAIQHIAAETDLVSPGALPGSKQSQPISPDEAGAALTLAPQVFSNARARIALMFKIRIALALFLTVTLIVTLIACIISAMQGNNAWAIVFGGITLIDLLAFAYGKPLTAITDVVVASQRLELLHERIRLDLQSFAQLDDPKERIDRQGLLWKSIQDELAAMSP